MMDDIVERLRVPCIEFGLDEGWIDAERKEAANKIEALVARVAKADALAKWVEGIIEDGCPKCGGDCSSANPPVAYCPMLEAMSDLAAYRESDT